MSIYATYGYSEFVVALGYKGEVIKDYFINYYHSHSSLSVHLRDGHVEVARAYYSAPPEYLGRSVWVRWDARLVRLYNERFEQIAVHPRVEPGRFRTQHGHLADEKISLVEKGAGYMLSRTRLLGEDAHAWVNSMIEARGVEGVRVLQGFLSLANRYPAGVLNRASQTALEARCFRLRPLRQLCRRYAVQLELPLSQEHPIIRPLADYQALVRRPKVIFKTEGETA